MYFLFTILYLSIIINEEALSLPHYFTDEELKNKSLIYSMSRDTEPPNTPIRNIAEFEPMQGVLIRYPFGISTSMIREMAEDVKIYCLVSSSLQNSAYNSMNNADVDMTKVEFITGSTDSYWTRDYGPWWVVDGDRNVGIVDFTYNRPRPNDNQAPIKVSNHIGTPYFATDMISTGGNYMTDGLGMAAATHIAYTENSQCNTNDQTSIPLANCNYVDTQMNDYYGINQYHVIADPNNEYIDHIDCWGKFLSPQKLLIRSVPTNHPQYNEIENVVSYFQSIFNSYGEPWEIFRVYTPNDQPYTNSLILNDKVFVPTMGSSWDDDALNIYQEALPGYEILGFSGSWQSTDALHCRTKGIPDLEMLQIFHNPLNDYIEPQSNGYQVQAIIDDLSESGLIDDEVRIFYKSDLMDQFYPIDMGVCDIDIPDCYQATIPPQQEDTNIYYFITARDYSDRYEKLPMAGYYDFSVVATQLVDDGDVNMDENINVLDVVLTVNYVLGSGDLSDYQIQLSDLNNDTIVNILDIILIVNIILEN